MIGYFSFIQQILFYSLVGFLVIKYLCVAAVPPLACCAEMQEVDLERDGWKMSKKLVCHTLTTTIGLHAPDNPAYHPHTANHNGHSHALHIGYVYESLCIC